MLVVTALVSSSYLAFECSLDGSDTAILLAFTNNINLLTLVLWFAVSLQYQTTASFEWTFLNDSSVL
jgi:hypothetical protein